MWKVELGISADLGSLKLFWHTQRRRNTTDRWKTGTKHHDKNFMHDTQSVFNLKDDHKPSSGTPCDGDGELLVIRNASIKVRGLLYIKQRSLIRKMQNMHGMCWKGCKLALKGSYISIYSNVDQNTANELISMELEQNEQQNFRTRHSGGID